MITTVQNRHPLPIATVSATPSPSPPSPPPPEEIPRGTRRYHHRPLYAPVDLLRQSAPELAGFCRFVDAGSRRGRFTPTARWASRSGCTTIFYLMALGVPLRAAVLGVAATRGRIASSPMDVIALQRLEGRVAEVRELLADIPASSLAGREALSQAFQWRL